METQGDCRHMGQCKLSDVRKASSAKHTRWACKITYYTHHVEKGIIGNVTAAHMYCVWLCACLRPQHAWPVLHKEVPPSGCCQHTSASPTCMHTIQGRLQEEGIKQVLGTTSPATEYACSMKRTKHAEHAKCAKMHAVLLCCERGICVDLSFELEVQTILLYSTVTSI